MSQAKYKAKVRFGVCENCRLNFSYSYGKERKFCSRACFHKANGKSQAGKIRSRVVFKCHGCGLVKIVPPHESKVKNKNGQQCKNRYCSYECSRDSKRKSPGRVRNCHRCGKELSVTRKSVKRTCRECMPAFRAENKTRNKVSELIRRRVNHFLTGNTKSKRTMELLGCD